MMKKFIVGLVAIVIFVCGAAMTACAPKSSSAVTIDELIREDFAAEKEAEDDAKGREHIEIPEGAEEIEIEGETWQVIRNFEEYRNKIFRNGDEGLTGSFILANDVDVNAFKPTTKIFKGKFNGNNYKFYGTKENGGFASCLFARIEDAVIENLIFSSSDGFYSGAGNGNNVLLTYYARNCIIKNCVNYYQPKNDIMWGYGGFVEKAHDCDIENCINYADLLASAGIVNDAFNCHITNCINYGNISSGSEGGGIVGEIYGDCVIESCINYGNIIGYRFKGGIIGGVKFGLSQKENYTENQIIKNCKNYGDIYVLKEKETNRLEQLDYVISSDLYCIGGIAGSVAKVENCTNEGNFYGFESFGKGIKVDYSGGIVGIAKEVVDCTSTHTIPVPKNKAKNVGEIYGILLGD